ncbi:MAG: energy-coupling factor ABC transporter ATP-binding protein, partial [Spirochaeta sp.]
MTDALFAAHQLTALAPDSDQALLREVSLSIPKSGITLLTGRNGSGKTILLRTLIGLHDTWHGECLYNGRSLRKSIPRIRREVGFLFQNPLYQLVERSVLDDIILSLRYRGISRTEALKQIEPIVESLQLSSLLHRDPYSLSTGEQRRTIIAGMLAGGAKTLLLDEPFTGLDYPGACELIRHILQLRSAGCSVIVCTHDL